MANIPRRSLFGKLNISLFKAIESATTFAKLRGNPYVELTHWLHQLVQQADCDLVRIAQHYGISRTQLDNELTQALSELPNGATSISNFSRHIDEAIERAWIISTLIYNDQRIRSVHLLSALLQDAELRPAALTTVPSLRKIPADLLQEVAPALILHSSEAKEPAHDGSGLTSALPGEASGAIEGDNAQPKSALQKYCTDLTAQAAQGHIDPVIGRESEVRTMIDILLRRRQNNPLLTGEAGVGKTAIVEGLALAIAEGNVPPLLATVQLLSLDVGALLAGASMKGEFESRLKSVLNEAAQSARPIILFVDEIHTLIGAGGQAGTGDAANLLKPALARGALRTIGATTWSEYKRHIEKDAALTRRFQVLQILEPNEHTAIQMVRGLVGTFEKHHGVLILDEALRAAVTLSHRYIPSRQLPDKAISLLDTACARVALSLHTPPARLQRLQRDIEATHIECQLVEKQIRIGKAEPKTLATLQIHEAELQAQIAQIEQLWQTEKTEVHHLIQIRTTCIESKEPQSIKQLQDLNASLSERQGQTPLVYADVNAACVADIVAEWTGIPVGRMVKDDLQNILSLPEHLETRVIGQHNALAQIAQRIQVARSGMADEKKPIGVFLLVGPSGVGKTETALSLAEALYGGEQNLITINMSEFQEAHTVSTLKGAPPGYVGYGEGGVLTEAVRRRPYSVVLLDEIEKAHRDVHELFFQVFDKGWMEDGEGRHIDFRNTVILLTSNVGANRITQLHTDPELQPQFETLAPALQDDLLDVFPAAFLGRVTVVPYLPLQADVVQKIVSTQLTRVAKRVHQKHGIDVSFTPNVNQHIVNACHVANSGARLLIGYIEQQVLPRLSQIWLDGQLTQRQPSVISIDVVDGQFTPTVHYTEIPFSTPPTEIKESI